MLFRSGSGRDFGAFLGGLGELGYGWAYRSLDAQYFGLAQRRERVFVVGCLGDWRRAAAVLFEPESLRGHPSPRRKAGEGVAPTIAARTKGGGGLGTDFDCDGGLISHPLLAKANPSHRADAETYVAGTLKANNGGGGFGSDPSETFIATIQERAVCENASAGPDGMGVRTDGLAYTLEARSVPQSVALCLNAHPNRLDAESETLICGTLTGNGDAHSGFKDEHGLVTHALRADGFDASEDGTGRGTPLTLAIRGRGDSHDLEWRGDGTSNAILTPNGGRAGIGVGAIQHASAVRRLTPRECARLQGFPDDYLDITYRGKPAADGNKYKALGNSMAVPVMRWIGQRIKAMA